MALVQAEPKKKPAPPPPPGNSNETPSRTSEEDGEEVGKASSEQSRSDITEPKLYNPFEEEDEEEVESADTQKSTPEEEQSETAAKPLHPWYGITPTSSPKAKKRPAPRAPNASPLGELPPAPLSLLCSPCTSPWRFPHSQVPLHHPSRPGLYAVMVTLACFSHVLSTSLLENSICSKILLSPLSPVCAILPFCPGCPFIPL